MAVPLDAKLRLKRLPDTVTMGNCIGSLLQNLYSSGRQQQQLLEQATSKRKEMSAWRDFVQATLFRGSESGEEKEYDRHGRERFREHAVAGGA